MFHEDLEKAMDKKACSHHTIMSGFNAKTGVRNINENIKCIGLFGTGNRNERGERLLDVAEENNLVVTNSLFLNIHKHFTKYLQPSYSKDSFRQISVR